MEEDQAFFTHWYKERGKELVEWGSPHLTVAQDAYFQCAKRKDQEIKKKDQEIESLKAKIKKQKGVKN